MTAFDSNFRTPEVQRPSGPGILEQAIHEVHSAYAFVAFKSPVADLPDHGSLEIPPIAVAGYNANPHSATAMSAADELIKNPGQKAA